MNSFFIQKGFALIYETEMPIAECMRNICELPWEYKCDIGLPLWYKCAVMTKNQLWITFTGGQFRKITHSQYSADFKSHQGKTLIVLTFQKEMLGLPCMTLPSDIDLFMKQKTGATRQNPQT